MYSYGFASPSVCPNDSEHSLNLSSINVECASVKDIVEYIGSPFPVGNGLLPAAMECLCGMKTSSLDVSGDSSLRGNVSVMGNLDVSGSVTVNSLIIGSDGPFTVASLDVSGMAVFHGTSTHIYGSLDISGETTLGTATMDSVTASSLGVSGTSHLVGSVDTSGTVTVYNTTASSSSTTGAMVISGGLGVGGQSFFGNGLRISSPEAPTVHSSLILRVDSSGQTTNSTFVLPPTTDLSGCILASTDGSGGGWISLWNFLATPVWIFSESQPSGTASSDAFVSATWTTRTLNTAESSTYTPRLTGTSQDIIDLSGGIANAFRMGMTGLYHVSGYTVATGSVATGTISFQSCVADFSGTVVATGTSVSFAVTLDTTKHPLISEFDGYINCTVPNKLYQVMYYGRNLSSMGAAVSTGHNEIYTRIKIKKVK